MAKYLIVNADDYGLTRGVSAGIRQAHLNGIVSSTSAMMNFPGALEDVKTAQRECPNLGFGVHLVLTAGRPILPPERVPSLVDENGLFFRQAAFLERLDRIDPDEALLEWRAQVELFKQSGFTPDHLDSHHHSSYFTPALLERMLVLAEENQCAIRMPYGDNPADFAFYLSPEDARKYQQNASALLKQYQPRMAQVFFSDFYDDGATHSHLLEILGEIVDDVKHDSFELMCHPAVVDKDLHTISDYHNVRGRELEILQDAEIRQKIADFGIQLISCSSLL